MKIKRSRIAVLLLFVGLPCYGDNVDVLAQALGSLAVLKVSPKPQVVIPVTLQDEMLLVPKQKKLFAGNVAATKAWNNLTKDQRKQLAPVLDDLEGFLKQVQGGTLDFYIQTYKPVIIEDPKAKEVETWLENPNEGGKYKGLVDLAREDFKNIQDYVNQATSYSTVGLKQAKNALVGIVKGATISTAGRLDFKDGKKMHTDLQGVLKSFEKALPSAQLSNENKKELLKDLSIMAVLDPALLSQIVGFPKKYELRKTRYDFMVDVYKIAIGYVEKIVDLWKSGKLSGGNEKDLDFALGYYTYIKPYLDQAELDSGAYSSLTDTNEKNEAAKFVAEVNGLNKYLMALLYKKRDLLQDAGFDFSVMLRLSEDETQRSWCEFDLRDDKQLIDATQSRHMTYKQGNDLEGRPLKNPETQWIIVDKTRPFYYRYSALLEDIVEVIGKYGKSKFASVNRSIEEYVISMINKFDYYFKIARGQGYCKVSLCSACFARDLMGNFGGKEEYVPVRYDQNNNKKTDYETIIKKSASTKDMLIKIKKFLSEIQSSRSEKGELVETIDKAIASVKDLLKYKKELSGGAITAINLHGDYYSVEAKKALEAFKLESK